MSLETAVIDPLDASIIRCIQLAPRAPFRTVAEVLDVSEQTVARRWRRLERDGLARVTVLLRPGALGQQNWMVRVQVRPSGAEALARALSQRDDVSWVTLMSGGSEIVCVLRSRTSEARDELLMQKLPRTAPVLGMSVAMVLHRFTGAGGQRDWSGLSAALTDGQEAGMVAVADDAPDAEQLFDLTADDHRLIAALNRNGRATFAQLAAATGMTESRVARRIPTLVAGGAMYFDVDVSSSALGLDAAASLWLVVSPGDLDRAGRALAATPEVAFAGAITGPSNLCATVVCRNVEDLYRFVTAEVGAIAGVQSMEVAPVLRSVKQAGALTDGDRLAVQ